MDKEWIAVGVLGATLLWWCRPRRAERVVLSGYSLGTQVRLFLDPFSWRDAVAPSDHVVLRRVRRRGYLGAGMMLLSFSLVYGSLQNDPESVVPRPNPIKPIASPLPASSPPPKRAAIPSASEQPEPETLESLRSPTRLYGTAKVKPVYRLHDVEGARITNIEPGSFWALLGVRNGDVVIELHGSPIDTPAALVALMNVMERDEHVAIRVRGLDGEVRYLEFRIPDDISRDDES